jgi:small subunit ribosomal protein S1
MDREQGMVGQPEGTQQEEQPVASEEIVGQEQFALPAEGSQEGEETIARPSDVESLKPGMRLQGKVRNVVEFGAFIDIGVGRDGLAHVSTLKRAGIDKTLQVGDVIDVQVRRIDLDTNRISLTIPGAAKGTKTSLRDLEVGATVTGRVVRLVDFGAFVDIGAQTDGLLHISALPGGFVHHPSEVVNVGDEVQVRIQEVDTARRRISLTMKEEGAEEQQSQQRPAPQRERASAVASRFSNAAPRQSAPSRSNAAPRQSGRSVTTVSTSDGESGEAVPTAFQVAWERALSEQRNQH